MGLPKKKMSHARIGKRRSAPGHGQVQKKEKAKCSNCSAQVPAHCVCYNCGFYKGVKVQIKMAK